MRFWAPLLTVLTLTAACGSSDTGITTKRERAACSRRRGEGLTTTSRWKPAIALSRSRAPPTESVSEPGRSRLLRLNLLL